MFYCILVGSSLVKVMSLSTDTVPDDQQMAAFHYECSSVAESSVFLIHLSERVTAVSMKLLTGAERAVTSLLPHSCKKKGQKGTELLKSMMFYRIGV